MKPETKEVILDFIDNSDAIGNDLLDDVEEYFGEVPFIFSILKQRPHTFALNTLAEWFTARPESLDMKTAELITIAAAAASNSPSCLRVHIRAAMNAGASYDEILDSILIACLVGKTRLLASSLRTLDAEYRDD